FRNLQKFSFSFETNETIIWFLREVQRSVHACSPDSLACGDQSMQSRWKNRLDRRVDGFDTETCSARVANPTSLETFGFLSDWHHERIHEAETNAAWISPISLSS
ncbi:hypothetical protein V1478_013145, partial [Vespula squamosa]